MMTLLLKSMWRNVLRGGSINSYGSISFKSRSLQQSSNLPELTHQNRNVDAVMASLQTASTPAMLLATVQKHLPTMTHNHLLQALRSLFELRKAGKVVETEELVNDPTFGILCHNFKLHARALDVNETIEAIKVLTYLGMSAHSLIVQTILQMIRCNINELGIRQIMFLDFILSRFDEKNHLVDAMKLALPLAFQVHLPLELDQEDLPLLKDMLLYCGTHDMPDRCINNVVTGLLLHDQKIDAVTAKSIVWSLCNMNCTEVVYPTRAQLLHICYDILSIRIQDLNYDDVLRTAAKIKGRVLEKHPEYYDANLFDAIGDYVVNLDVDFAKALLVARILSRIAHTHLRLADYLCTAALEEPSSLTNARANTLFAFVNYLANNNFKPDNMEWEKICTFISSNPILRNQLPQNLPWTKFSLELAALGHYDDNVLAVVFSDEYLKEFTCRSNNPLDYLQLLTLNEAVRLFHSTSLKLPEDISQKAKSMYPTHAITDRVLTFLAAGLGGEECIAKNVVLPSGIVADILVCLDKRVPIRLPRFSTDDKIPIEKLNLPSGSIPICIMTFNQGCFSMNSNRLRGTFRLILDIIEEHGYIAVPLNVNQWLSSPAHEKTPYLMREIDYKCCEMGTLLMVT